MNKQRIQVYADPETRRRIGLAAAKHQMPVTEYCFEAIRQQLATEALTFAEGKEAGNWPTSSIGLVPTIPRTWPWLNFWVVSSGRLMNGCTMRCRENSLG